MVYLHSERLAKCMKQALQNLDVAPIAIAHVVNSLVQTSLRGVDSHGINLFPHYCQAVEAGRINRDPEFETDRTATGSAILDADHGFGHHAGAVAIDYAVDLAKENGIAAVAVKNSTHFGAAAYFALRAADKGQMGFAFTNADALVKVHNSRESFFGTNPICCAAPMADEEPFCLDMATSLAAWNKVNNARRTGNSIPDNWAFNEQGETVIDPHQATSLAPVGGYKGFDLGMMVDIFCALFSGGPVSKDILPMYGAPIEARRYISHFFMAIDIPKFSTLEDFTYRLQDMTNRIRGLDPAPQADDQVMVAGDPEKREYPVRLQNGIPMDPEKFAEYLDVSADFEQARIT